MKYTFDSRIRYTEVGENQKITLPAILNYFQDCSIFHSEDVNLGINYLAENKRVWLLSSWQIVIDRYPALGEEITISTWPYEFKRFFGKRNFTMKTSAGEMAAYANSLWIYMDTQTGLPATVAEAELKGYQLYEKLEMDYEKRKIRIPGTGQIKDGFTVQASHLDTNHHVNNGQYVQMALEWVANNFVIHQMRAEYKKQAVLGDWIIPKVCEQKDCYLITLCDKEENPYVIIEFR